MTEPTGSNSATGTGPLTPRTAAPAPARTAPAADRHRSQRHRLPRGFLALVGVPGSSPVAVSARDLSRTGLGFYCADMMPAGGACQVTLRSITGELVVINARITRCRHVRDRVYDTGLRLSSPIDPARFVELSATPSAAARPLSPGPAPELPAPGTVAPEPAATPHDRVAELAESMRRIASEQAPLDELHAMVEELVKLCQSARAPDEPEGESEA